MFRLSLILFCLYATQAYATANGVTLTAPDNQYMGCDGCKPVGVADPNNAAYGSISGTFATGAVVPAGRAIYLNCAVSGTVTMALSGGGSISYPVAATPYVLPFAVVTMSADTASCSHQNLN